MPVSTVRWCRILTLAFLFAWTHGATAQPDPTNEPSGQVTLDQIDAVRGAIDSEDSLDEEAKAAAQKLLDQAALDLQRAEASAAERASMQQSIDDAERLHDSIQQKIESLKSEPPRVDEDQPLAALQQSQVDVRAKLNKAETTLADASAESSRRQARLLAIPEARDVAAASLAETQKKLTLAEADGSTTPSSEAVKLRLQASKQNLTATLEALKTEQAYYATTNDTLPLQRELAEQQVATYRQQLETINLAIGRLRQDEISQLRRQVRKHGGSITGNT